MHRPVRVEHVAQRLERRLGVRKMVQTPVHTISSKRHLQVADPIDRQLMDLEIGQVVLVPEILRVPHARRAEVDPDDPGGRTARGVAACDAPQPAMRIGRSSEYGLSGQNRWKSARRLFGSCHRRR